MECPNQTAPDEFILSGFPCTEDLKVPFVIFFSVIFALTLCGNSLIILAMITNFQLHKPMYWCLCHLSILDMAFSAVVIPKVSAGFTCVILSLGIIIGGTLHSAFQSSLTFHLPYGENYINYIFCDIPSILKLACIEIHVIEMVIIIDMGFVTITCFLLILASYAYIITAILKISSNEGRHRAFSTCSAYLTVVVIYYLPLFSRYLRLASPDIMESVVCVFYTTITSLLNPIIYTLRNKEMKTALVKLWGANPE
uniref:G-protein coupled receptors family 1 profile domain-containing protein n=1 Tax=Laticauda laticaudata TaxID=8630 RepID=A0A8C5RCN0_LATLA